MKSEKKRKRRKKKNWRRKVTRINRKDKVCVRENKGNFPG